jgi:hypothetical protein
MNLPKGLLILVHTTKFCVYVWSMLKLSSSKSEERISFVDLLVETLIEHEKHLSTLTDRLEKITQELEEIKESFRRK